MDLSHWDAVTFFDRDQIAQLLAGVDPNGGAYSKASENKVKLYRELVSVAIANALKHAWEHVRGLTEPPDVIAPDIYEFDPWEDELPSYEIRCSVAEVLSDPVNVPILLPTDSWYTEKFHRGDVHFWATSRGFNKGYRFDGIANDRIPDDPQGIARGVVGFLEHGYSEQSREDGLARNARAAANARHSRPGGSRDKRRQIQEIWKTGKYSSRDVCAEQESAALGMSFSSARKALRGTPDPA